MLDLCVMPFAAFPFLESFAMVILASMAEGVEVALKKQITAFRYRGTLRMKAIPNELAFYIH